MQTAITNMIVQYEKQLKDHAELEPDLSISGIAKAVWDADQQLYKMFISHLKASLPAEQKQIVDSFTRGVAEGYHATTMTGADYYHTTFTAPDGDKTNEKWIIAKQE